AYNEQGVALGTGRVLVNAHIGRMAVRAAYRGFFFQAEDGIRDFHVTGVQTCALPIFLRFNPACIKVFNTDLMLSAGRYAGYRARSEERRVGKECRAQWGQAESYKKKGVALGTGGYLEKAHICRMARSRWYQRRGVAAQ